MIPVAEIGAARPFPLAHGFGVVAGALRKLQQEGEHMLGDRAGAVAGDIGDGHALLAGRRHFHDIVARGQHATIAQAWQALQDGAIEQGFIGENDIGGE